MCVQGLFKSHPTPVCSQRNSNQSYSLPHTHTYHSHRYFCMYPHVICQNTKKCVILSHSNSDQDKEFNNVECMNERGRHMVAQSCASVPPRTFFSPRDSSLTSSREFCCHNKHPRFRTDKTVTNVITTSSHFTN